jgi:nucleotidyltransferase/DNA polymerase involved in DNA repair
MRILCSLIPHFPVSLQQCDEPRLEGRPLVIVQEGEVMDCSPEALDQGIRVGMRVERAEKLCPEALVRVADIARYERAFEKVIEVLAEVSPVVEAGKWGEAYADVSAQAPDLEGEGLLCREVGRRLGEEVGLTGMMGVAGTKFTSYAAAWIIRWGQALLLRPGTERDFLAQLPVDLLSADGDVIEELRLLGIRSMGQFAHLPRGAIMARFGPQGRKAHQLAQGRDRRPLVPYRSPPVEEAARQFEPPLEMDETLVQAVGELAHACCRRLRQRGFSCQKLQLILFSENGRAHSTQRTLSGPTAHPEIVGTSARELLSQHSPVGRVTEVYMRLGMLQAQEGKQLNLGAISRPTEVNLACLVRPLATRFGADRFCGGRVLNSSSPLAELRFAWQSCKV